VSELPVGAGADHLQRTGEAVVRGRRTKVQSNYLDLGQLADYWSPARFNHHTAPTAMVYGLREALRAVHDEGLEARFARHRLHGDALRAGLDASGLTLFGKEPREHRLPFLTPVVVPEGVDELRVRRRLVEDFGIEIGAAFGQLQGKVWRIGTWATRPSASSCSFASSRSRTYSAAKATAPRRRRPRRGPGPLRLRRRHRIPRQHRQPRRHRNRPDMSRRKRTSRRFRAAALLPQSNPGGRQGESGPQARSARRKGGAAPLRVKYPRDLVGYGKTPPIRSGRAAPRLALQIVRYDCGLGVPCSTERPRLLVVHDDLQGQPRAARPLRIGRRLAVPDGDRAGTSLGGGCAPLPTGGAGLRPALALPPPGFGLRAAKPPLESDDSYASGGSYPADSGGAEVVGAVAGSGGAGGVRNGQGRVEAGAAGAR